MEDVMGRSKDMAIVISTACQHESTTTSADITMTMQHSVLSIRVLIK